MMLKFRGHCIVNDLILKTSNDDGHSLNAVLSSRSGESYIKPCKQSSDIC